MRVAARDDRQIDLQTFFLPRAFCPTREVVTVGFSTLRARAALRRARRPAPRAATPSRRRRRRRRPHRRGRRRRRAAVAAAAARGADRGGGASARRARPAARRSHAATRSRDAVARRGRAVRGAVGGRAHDMAWHGMTRHGMAPHGMKFDLCMAWHGIVLIYAIARVPTARTCCCLSFQSTRTKRNRFES